MIYLYRYFPLFILLIFNTVHGSAQRLKRADKQLLAQLELHQRSLSGDTTVMSHQRRMDYISEEFRKNGLEPKKGASGYLCSFQMADGVVSEPGSFLFINGDKIPAGQFIPLLKSPEVVLEATPSLALREEGQPWFLDIGEQVERFSAGGQAVPVNTSPESPFGEQLAAALLAKAREAKSKGATALFLYNTSARQDGLVANSLAKENALPLPVVYVQPEIARKYFDDVTVMLEIKLKIAFTEKKITRNYVAGLVNNQAPVTVVIKAVDDAVNAPVLIELASSLKKSKAKDKNYLLVAVAGGQMDEQQGEGQKGIRSLPVKADYRIEAGQLTGVDRLRYMYSVLEQVK